MNINSQTVVSNISHVPRCCNSHILRIKIGPELFYGSNLGPASVVNTVACYRDITVTVLTQQFLNSGLAAKSVQTHYNYVSCLFIKPFESNFYLSCQQMV